MSLGSKTISSCASQKPSTDFSQVSLAEFCHPSVSSQTLARVMELQDEIKLSSIKLVLWDQEQIPTPSSPFFQLRQRMINFFPALEVLGIFLEGVSPNFFWKLQAVSIIPSIVLKLLMLRGRSFRSWGWSRVGTPLRRSDSSQELTLFTSLFLLIPWSFKKKEKGISQCGS